MDTSALDLRFRIGSFPITITPFFWLSGLILMQPGTQGAGIVLWLVVFLVSILVHELGHAVAARAFGARATIELHSFGGHTRSLPRLSRWRDVAMTLAGPGAGFLLAAAAFGVLSTLGVAMPVLLRSMVAQLVWVNIIWGIFNLLPVPPLDGGHVLLNVLGQRHERTARIIAVVVASLGALYGLQSHQLFLTIMFGLLAFQNIQTLRALGGR